MRPRRQARARRRKRNSAVPIIARTSIMYAMSDLDPSVQPPPHRPIRSLQVEQKGISGMNSRRSGGIEALHSTQVP